VSGTSALEIRTSKLKTPDDVAEAFRAVNPDATFRSDFELATMPKSRARIIRYMLAKLSNAMAKRTRRTGAEEIVNADAKEVNIEQVLPQSVPESWKREFSRKIDANEFVHRIGNLTLLTAKINRDAADGSFAEKKKLAFSTSRLPHNEVFKTLTSW